MNKYDEKYEIRLANQSDISDIMCFIEEHWKSGHILARDRAFFEYEFCIDDKVNFIIARERNTNQIEGINGFLLASKGSSPDIWGCVWKVKPNNMLLLGVEIEKRMMALSGCRNLIGIGSNPHTAVPLYKKMLRHTPVKLEHFYRLNKLSQYNVAVINNTYTYKFLENSSAEKSKLIKMNDIEELCRFYNCEENKELIPYKDEWYINRRFFVHPYYKYEIYGVADKHSNARAILVLKKVEENSGKALRIIDYIGDQSLIPGLYEEFSNMLDGTDFEYIDFYCYGFNEGEWQMAGFKKLDENDNNIIPNYFEPFVPQNVEIWGHAETGKTVIYCKGDGDQDRPSFVRSGEKVC